MNRHDRRRQRAMDRENRFRIAQPVPTIFLAPFHPFASPIRKIRKSKKLDRRKSSGIPVPGFARCGAGAVATHDATAGGAV